MTLTPNPTPDAPVPGTPPDETFVRLLDTWHEAAEDRRRLEVMESTTSWRVTAPIRWVLDLFRGRRPGAPGARP